MRNVLSSLSAHAAHQPDKPAFIMGQAKLTYADLAVRVHSMVSAMQRLPEVIGILGSKSFDWVVTDLALAAAGKTVVPLPEFFSHAQLRYIVQDAGVEHIILLSADCRDLAMSFGVPVGGAAGCDNPPALAATESRRIIYTSGTTGNPKGVRLSARQFDASIHALTVAAEATAADRHLSILPLSLLLEQIAGLYVPLVAGATVHLCPDAFGALLGGNPTPMLDAFNDAEPSVSVLVPEMLGVWINDLKARNKRAPADLRYVAVGGAPVGASIAEQAWHLGIPVYEGYGLSECTSVVSVNTPSNRKPGSVGRPLPGVQVTLADGEIVVAGPTVMGGYVGGETTGGRWHTGDLGTIDGDGYLHVTGRKDNIIVTALGRNFSPEWVELSFQADPRFARTIVFADGAFASVVVTPSPRAQAWFDSIGTDELERAIAANCAHLPDYARPRRVILTDEADLRRNNLVTANGRPNRRQIAERFGS